MATFIKDPDAELDYARDWSTWLAVGEVILTSTWTVPTGLTLGSTAPSFVGGVATIWLKGGTVGTSYAVTNKITTSDGRTDERTFTIRVEQR